MLRRQTRQPDIIELVNDAAKSDDIDITWRYRTGYARVGDRADCILFMENDDWYADNYIETMVEQWIAHDKPQIFGTCYTMYYNLAERKYKKWDHFRRSSAMSTLIVTGLEVNWGDDKNPYTDSWLWLRCKLVSRVFKPAQPICMGIKHGIGLTGGLMHTTKLEKYKHEDPDFTFLKNWVDPESYKFYTEKICGLL